MDSNNFWNIIANSVNDFQPGKADLALLSKYELAIRDNDYFSFIEKSGNGGFFYGQSLHIYGYSDLHDFHSIEVLNSMLRNEYGNIIDDLVAFAQDLFGNQFCFDTSARGVVFFDSETGERDPIASGYAEWLNKLDDHLEYFTGVNVLNDWLSNNKFEFGYRLCPKIPFIMGGEYKVNNLYGSKFPDFIKSYANIARQVYNLPDGTPVKLNMTKK